MWRTTPLHRREVEGRLEEHPPPPLSPELNDDRVQPPEAGTGAFFHRTYRTRIRDTQVSPEELVDRIGADPDRVLPTEFASFEKVLGEPGRLEAGDEYVVRMAAPWDGPVRVVHRGPASFRLATLSGHLEAGQIEFRAISREGLVVFEIESWARSKDWLTDLLYDRLRMSKEVQLHMWTSTLEQIAELAGGRRTGGVDIETVRIDAGQMNG